MLTGTPGDWDAELNGAHSPTHIQYGCGHEFCQTRRQFPAVVELAYETCIAHSLPLGKHPSDVMMLLIGMFITKTARLQESFLYVCTLVAERFFTIMALAPA